MATKNIVPNADSEGGIGTSSKYWATGYIDAITTTGNLVVGGNTGIGDSSPSQKLVVEGDWNQAATNNNQVYIQGSTNSNMQLRLGYDTTGDHGYIQSILNGTGGRELHLNTSGGAVVIADSGTIGCVSDTDLLTLASGALTVSGSATFTGDIVLTGSASNLNFSSSQDANITMSATSSGTDGRNLSIFAGASSNNASDNGGDLILRGGNAGANGSSQILFRTATTSHAYGITAEQMKIDAVGDVSVTNNLFIGSGKAIYVGGTAAANGLDDYEEGTFTPTIDVGFASPGYSTQYGSYTKIGRIVNAHFRITMNAGTANSERVRIGGLPFTSLNNANDTAVASHFISVSASKGDIMKIILLPNTTYFEIYGQNATNVSSVIGSQVGNTFSFFASVTYET